MGKVYDRIDDRIRGWVDNQQMFFVATAPLSGDGLVNLSPKGLDTFCILDDRTVAYMDFGGSGIETVSHVRENGRIVIMMCAFEGPPLIFRFHGTGEIVTPADPGYEDLARHFDRTQVGIRAIIKVNVERISDSCGYGVPFYDYQGQRDTPMRHLRQKGADGVRQYIKDNNAESLDGLPGLTGAEADAFQAPDGMEAAE
jgi:hypothetical protein